MNLPSKNLLLIGDMHVKKDNLEESERIIDWICLLTEENNATPIFMGDQHDTMSVVRTEVISFWDSAYRKIGINKSYSIEGNHDLCPSGLTSAMTAHNEITKVITKNSPVFLDKDVAAIGYIRDKLIFTQKILDLYNKGARHILCHSEFYGAQYENGFYAPHGIELDNLPKDLMFISGHIHKRQLIINSNTKQTVVNYIGTPRMITRSDIGETKGVTIFNTETKQFKFIETPEKVSEPFKFFVIKQGDLIPEIKNSSKTYIDIIGTNDFIKSIYKKIPDRVKTRSIIQEENKEIEIKESEGIASAFSKYANSTLDLTLTKEQKQEVLSSIYEKCPFLKEA
jgi:DNA repair exonuclease SbcCD nuclease subunit